MSGYSTLEMYNQRQPDWTDDNKYATKDEALRAAQLWQSSHGEGSSVEVIEQQGTVGNVRAVIDKYGTEDI